MVQVQYFVFPRVAASRWSLITCFLTFWACQAIPAPTSSIQSSNHTISIQEVSDRKLRSHLSNHLRFHNQGLELRLTTFAVKNTQKFHDINSRAHKFQGLCQHYEVRYIHFWFEPDLDRPGACDIRCSFERAAAKYPLSKSVCLESIFYVLTSNH